VFRIRNSTRPAAICETIAAGKARKAYKMVSNRLSHRRGNARLPPICKKPPNPPPPILAGCDCGTGAVWIAGTRVLTIGVIADYPSDPPGSNVFASITSIPALAWANPYLCLNGGFPVLAAAIVPAGNTAVAWSVDYTFVGGQHCVVNVNTPTP